MATNKTIRNGVLGLIAAATAIAVPFICNHEGESLTAYQDVGKVWTICNGEAGVAPGTTMTSAQCASLTADRVGQFMGVVAALIRVPITPALLASHTSFAYNIGLSGYERSQALLLTNRGDLAGGCKAMLNWYTAGGRDCRVRANNCYGVVARRTDETNLCLQGAQPSKEK